MTRKERQSGRVLPGTESLRDIAHEHDRSGGRGGTRTHGGFDTPVRVQGGCYSRYGTSPEVAEDHGIDPSHISTRTSFQGWLWGHPHDLPKEKNRKGYCEPMESVGPTGFGYYSIQVR